jgi:hypothetical protein
MYRFFLVLFFLVPVNRLFSQDNNIVNEKQQQEIIEYLASVGDEDVDYTQLFENLERYLNQPLDINNATKAELQTLGLLSDYQVQVLIDYRTEHGGFISLNELQYLYGYTVELLDVISPYITIQSVKENLSVQRISDEGQHTLLIKAQQNIEKQQGYKSVPDSVKALSPNSYYLGSPLRLLNKYKFNLGNKIVAGFTLEKDPGEELFRGNNSGFDFVSGHLLFNDIGKVKCLAFGDYQASFGQGVTLWSGVAPYKSAYITKTRRSALGFTRYSSSDENHFMRGVAVTYNLFGLDLSSFISHKNIDANIGSYDSITFKPISVSSFQTMGLHTLPSEIESKDALSETCFGGNLSMNKENFKVGITCAGTRYGLDVYKSYQPYNYYYFQGNEVVNVGADYLVNLKNISLFGELARCSTGDNAILSGITFTPVSNVSLVCLYRNYGLKYYAPYSNAFRERSEAMGEQGFYFGLETGITSNLTLRAYADYFNYPWLKYEVDAPSAGHEYLLQADYQISSGAMASFRFITQQKDENMSSEGPSPNNVLPVETNKYRFNISYKISSSLELRNRIEYVYLKKETATPKEGYLFYQDVVWATPAKSLSLIGRYCIFDTDDYDSRVYAYENNALYTYSIPYFYNKGYRTYFMAKYALSKQVDIWARYAITVYTDQTSIGQGVTYINGNKKSEVLVQMIVSF